MRLLSTTPGSLEDTGNGLPKLFLCSHEIAAGPRQRPYLWFRARMAAILQRFRLEPLCFVRARSSWRLLVAAKAGRVVRNRTMGDAHIDHRVGALKCTSALLNGASAFCRFFGGTGSCKISVLPSFKVDLGSQCGAFPVECRRGCLVSHKPYRRGSKMAFF